jgi:hypothetical protein
MLEEIRRSPHAVLRALSGFCLVVALCVVFFYRFPEPPLPALLRITESAGHVARHLEVPIVSYGQRSRELRDLRVDFIGAVHLGEKEYYRELAERFKDYDSVLFELVSDGKNLPGPASERRDSILGSFQRAFAGLLGLSFQLDEIDYQAKNFVHADLSPQRLKKAMDQRGESVLQLLVKIVVLSRDPEFVRALKEKGFDQGGLEDINPLLIILRGPTADERLKIKRFMANGLVGSEIALKLLEGEKGTALITDRNKEVVSVLKSEIAAGKRKIAILYGVGHLPDMHRQLKEGLELSITKVEWLQAWRM